MPSRIQLLSEIQIQRMVRRIAFEVIEKNKSAANLVIIGILNRGATLADQLAATIAQISDTPITAHHLNVSQYRDDTERDGAGVPYGLETLDVTDKDVLLVDDVLYTGRTVRAALDAVVALGRPQSIQLSVLIDRGHREYPIEPTYVGRHVPTKYREHVEVSFEDAPGVYVQE